VFPKERVDVTLETIRQISDPLSESGVVNYANPDGSAAQVAGYGPYSYFPPELMMLAMNYMYEGHKEYGTKLLYDCMYNIHCRHGYTWDAPNIMRGGSGYRRAYVWIGLLSGYDALGCARGVRK